MTDDGMTGWQGGVMGRMTGKRGGFFGGGGGGGKQGGRDY